MSNSPNFPQVRIDKSSLFIAAIAPLLWAVDAFRSAIFLNGSFVKEFFFPEPSALFLRLWLVFFILIQAWFFNRYSRTRNRELEIEVKLKSLFDLAQDALVVTDIEGKVVEASGKAQKLWGYSLKELSDLDLTRLCAANESERLINFIRQVIENKESGLENVMLAVKDSLTIPADIEGRFIDNLGAQDKPGIFLNVARHKIQEIKAAAIVAAPETPWAKPEAETPAEKPEEMRLRIESAIRQEEAKKSQEALKNLEQKYLELMRVRLAEECKKAEDAVRLEEKKKAEQQIKVLEAASSQAVEEKLKQERARIEETIKQEEAKKSQQQADALEHKYSGILKARVAEASRQAEELLGQELKKKYEEQLRQAEAKFASESGSKISEGRKLIEDSIRREEQRKAEENAVALRQKYEELLRKGLEDERKRGEESAKLERGRLEANVRKEEQQKALEAINELKIKYEETSRKALEEERARAEGSIKQASGELEESIRQEERKKAEKRIRELEAKLTGEWEEKLRQERVRAEEEKKTISEAVREAEQKKALDAAKAVEKSHVQALAEAAKKVSEQAQVKAPELSPLEMGKMVKGLSLQVMNPLTAVLNNIKMMNIKLAQETDFKVSDVKDAVNAIEENALLCKSILNSLSGVSSGSGSSFKPFSLNDTIEKIDALYGKELRMQSITLQKMLLPNLPLVNGDSTLFFLVLFNMVSNAKWAINKNAYRSGGGTITIKTQKSEKEGFVELIISDNGVGITKQDLKHIFEPFFTTKKEGEGLGLGLAIVFEIIKAHKGEIHAETQIGSGAIFKIILPALS